MPNPILPIELTNGISLNPIRAYEVGQSYSSEYLFAEPFPHIQLDNFAPPEFLDRVLENFPKEPSKNDVLFMGGYAGHSKRQTSPYDCSQFNREAFLFFNSAPFLQFLSGLTGIEALIPDPYFAGAGFHEIYNGGKLGMHVDFRINQKLNLERRLNVLIYLNKNWDEDFGGALELWDKSMSTKVKKILPIFNRCVVFNTDHNSYHGHPDPLTAPDGVSRKSIALYYYTASEKIYEDLPMYSTVYKPRPYDSKSIAKETWSLNWQNYKKDWLPIAILNPRYLLPPILFRKLKAFLRRNQ